MKCPFCGKEIADESSFCLFCMKPLNAKKDTTKSFKKSRLNIVIIALATYIVLMLSLGGYFLFFHKSEKPNNYKKGTTTATSSIDRNETRADEKTSEPNEASEVSEASSSEKVVNSSSSQNAQSSTASLVSEIPQKAENNSSSKPESVSSKETNTTPSASACKHNWEPQTKTVHHDEEGHYETEEKAKKVTKYKCAVCYKLYTTLDDYYSHFEAHTEASGSSIDILRERYEIVEDWEYYDEKKWVVDKEAYNETVITGYKCSICGEKKQ